jgi:hypothetical protein
MGGILTFATSQTPDKTLLEEIKYSAILLTLRIYFGIYNRYNR